MSKALRRASLEKGETLLEGKLPCSRRASMAVTAAAFSGGREIVQTESDGSVVLLCLCARACDTREESFEYRE